MQSAGRFDDIKGHFVIDLAFRGEHQEPQQGSNGDRSRLPFQLDSMAWCYDDPNCRIHKLFHCHSSARDTRLARNAFRSVEGVNNLTCPHSVPLANF